MARNPFEPPGEDARPRMAEEMKDTWQWAAGALALSVIGVCFTLAAVAGVAMGIHTQVRLVSIDHDAAPRWQRVVASVLGVLGVVLGGIVIGLRFMR